MLNTVQVIAQLLEFGEDLSGCNRSTSLDAVQALTEVCNSSRELLAIALHCRRHAIGRAARFFSCPLRRCADLFELAGEPVKPVIKARGDGSACDRVFCNALVRRRPIDYAS
jgi:hypothetical protein